MKRHFTKAERFIEIFCDKAVLILGAIMFLALSYYSMRYTEMFMDGTEVMKTYVDSVPGNLLALLVCLAIMSLLRLLLSRLSAEMLKKVTVIVKVFTLLYVILVGIAWVAGGHVVPFSDAGGICTIAKLVYHGEYGTMIPPGYMSYYPHQYGLVFIMEILYGIFGDQHYIAFQYINVLWVVLMVYAAYRIIDLLFENDYITIFFSLLVMTCVPMLLYITYVYGEIPSISLCVVMMWSVLAYCKKGSLWAIFGMIIPPILAGMVRLNAIIVMIAVVIVLLFDGMKKRKPQVFIMIAGIMLPVFLVNSGIQKLYENRSGNEVLEGVPYISYIMMGLQDTEAGPGWHNGTDIGEYGKYDFDAKATAEADTEWVKTRLGEMWQNKAASVDFFRRKVLTQWNAPDYNALYTLDCFDCEFDELPEMIQSLFEGKLRGFLDKFMDRYQFVMYICVFVFLLDSLRRHNGIENHILLIAIIGGMLFSIMWEAMSRYILPYMIFSIPLMAAGVYTFQEWCIALWKCVHTVKKTSDEEMEQGAEESVA